MTRETNPIDEMIKRTRRYWYVDGLAEMGGGAVILLYAAYMVGVSLFTAGSPQIAAVALGLGQPLVILLGGLLVRRVVRHFKETLTFPRTGYVAYPRQKGSGRWKRIFQTAMIAAAVGAVVALVSEGLPENMMFLVSGVMIGLFLAYLGYTFGLTRFYIIAGLSALLGAACALLNFQGTLLMGVFFGGMGLMWVFSGLFTLRNYLRNTEPAQVEHE